jgi:hypothetical protein
MEELDARLVGNQIHLQRLLAARDNLQQSGTAALDEFRVAGKGYSDFIVTNMGHHAGTNDMAHEVFTPDDWVHMAYISDNDLANQESFYAAVMTATPDIMQD